LCDGFANGAGHACARRASADAQALRRTTAAAGEPAGIPPTYRLGFGDGCATARGTEQKDAARFSADGNYRTGWQDGVAQCKKK